MPWNVTQLYLVLHVYDMFWLWWKGIQSTSNKTLYYKLHTTSYLFILLETLSSLFLGARICRKVWQCYRYNTPFSIMPWRYILRQSSFIQAYLRYCVTPLTTDFTPDTPLRERVERSCWISLAWWHRLHNSLQNVDPWQCLIFRSEVARLPVYLRRAGKQRLWLAACTWGSSHWFWGAVFGSVLEKLAADRNRLVFGKPFSM
jgi:hypothetical protein